MNNKWWRLRDTRHTDTLITHTTEPAHFATGRPDDTAANDEEHGFLPGSARCRLARSYAIGSDGGEKEIPFIRPAKKKTCEPRHHFTFL